MIDTSAAAAPDKFGQGRHHRCLLAVCWLLLLLLLLLSRSLRVWVLFFVWFFVCFGFRAFWGFCGWVLEALCSPAQMWMQNGPAFRGSQYV